MQKQYLLALALSVIMLATGCGVKGSNKEVAKNMDKKTKSETTIQKTIEEKQKITVKELIITAGKKSIYGKIYAPADEEKHPTIILSHGYNGINTDFTKECRYYAENGYVAYAYDFCGGSVNSKSSGASTDMTIFTEKSDLLDVFNYIKGLDNVDKNSIFLFGGSQGGLVTTLAAEELSEQVKGMILYFPALCIADDWRKTYPNKDMIPDTNDFWGLKLGKNFFLSIHDFDTFKNIGSYPNDVLIIHGDKDPIVPLSYSEKAKETYKSAELVVLPGEGHGFSPIGGQKAMELVLKFMQKH